MNERPVSWVGWQVLNRRAPGRWSSLHATRNGTKALCGRTIPGPTEAHQFQHGDGRGLNHCPNCETLLVLARLGRERREARG
jgi:hypothetical protein